LIRFVKGLSQDGKVAKGKLGKGAKGAKGKVGRGRGITGASVA
jgi:hypothetical protein